MFAQIGYYICVPFAWLTRLFYTWTGSYGVALILFTLMVKLVLLPFQLKSKKSMLRMGRMNGKVQEIQKRYANNKEKQQQEIAAVVGDQQSAIIGAGQLAQIAPQRHLFEPLAAIALKQGDGTCAQVGGDEARGASLFISQHPGTHLLGQRKGAGQQQEGQQV